MAGINGGTFGPPDELWDSDFDTGIQVEKTADDDTIRYHLGGATPITDALTMEQTNGFVWNNAQDDLDMRFAGVVDPNQFYFDAGLNAVSIGTPVIGVLTNQFQINGATVTPRLTLTRADDGNDTTLAILSDTNTATRGAFDIFMRARNSGGSFAAVVDGDRVGVFRSDAHDGTEFVTGGLIQSIVDGTPTTGNVPMQWQFTTDDGTGNAIRMVLRADGKLGVNAPAPVALLDVRGTAIFNQGQGDFDFRVAGNGLANLFKIDAGLGYTRFGQTGAGTVMDVRPTVVWINNQNGDIDFRWDGDTNDYGIFGDAGLDRVGIWTGTPTSSLHVNGSIGIKITRNTTSATIDETAYQWNGDTDSAGFTYTLPAGVQDRQYKIMNVGTSTNQLTITPDGAENLLGANSSFVLNDGESLIIGYDATDGWY